MKNRLITGDLVDRLGIVVGRVCVNYSSNLYSGTINLLGVPRDTVVLFEEYEMLVNGQVLTLIDDLDYRIEQMKIVFVSEGNVPIRVLDLQVYPSVGRVSFRPDPS